LDRQVDMQTPTGTIGPRPFSVGQPRLAAAADGGPFRLVGRAMDMRPPPLLTTQEEDGSAAIYSRVKRIPSRSPFRYNS
jgi:hypothetical protein